MIATFLNVFTVLLGSILGIFFGGMFPVDARGLVQTAAGLVTLVLGIQMAFKTQRIVSVVVALALGGLVGYGLHIQSGVLALGEFLKNFSPMEGGLGTFAQGFLTASLLFCVGAMTIIGSFEAGAEKKYDLIMLKSVLDGFMAFIFASTLGVGVAFSSLTILVYQGGLTLAAKQVKPWVDKRPLVLSEVTGTGGILVMMIGFNLLEIKVIPTGDFLPALFFIVLLAMADPLLQKIGSKIGFGTRT